MALSHRPANAAKNPIRVFLVDDSPLALVMLKRLLATSPDIEIVGTARDGREALAAFKRAMPDVICTDYHMPNMDGLALIQETMAVFPRPILVISSTIKPDERHNAFPLLAAGAVDLFPKPCADTPFEQAAAELTQKIKLLSGIMVISRRASTSNAVARGAVTERPSAEARSGDTTSDAAPEVVLPHKTGLVRMIAVGASTGGPQVLQTIFTGLPADFPCPILCVQHISQGFLNGLVEWLALQCRVRVKIAEDNEIAVPGTVYFAPENTHLETNGRGRLIYAPAAPVDGHKPSITVTFESLAQHYRHSALGVLLTGMGSDGASGLDSIRRAGGTTLAQDEATCVVFGMPKQAIARGAAQFVLPPAEITTSLIRLTATR